MKKLTTLFAYIIGSLILFGAFGQAIAVTPQLSLRPRIADETNSSYYSTNWSGYAVTGSAVSSVSGSWVVPTVTGSRFTTAYSSFWVGIDGFSSNTVEQIGTDSDVRNGKAVYYAWYEFYPNPMIQISSLTIKPGDTISATVSYSSGSFTVTLTDKTTSHTYSTTGTVSGATESSAEWIAEAPSSNFGVLPLANFGTAKFGLDNTQIGTTCFATVSGTSGNIQSFGSAVQTITMVGGYGRNSYVKASPSSLSTDGTSFTDTWHHS